MSTSYIAPRSFVPSVSPWMLTDDEIKDLHAKLLEADRRSRFSRTEEERKAALREITELNERLYRANLEKRIKQQDAHQRLPNVHAQVAAQHVAAGRVVPTRPYFAENAAPCPAGRPGATQDVACTCRRHRWVDDALAMNARTDDGPISFEALAAMVAEARAKGMLSR